MSRKSHADKAGCEPAVLVPKGQTLDEALRNDLEQIGTHEGIVLAALSGDRDALLQFAGLAMCTVESASQWPEIRDWLIFVLVKIRSGEEPNKAFGWKQRRKGRPGTRSTVARLARAWRIGKRVQELRDDQPGVSDAALFRQAAVDCHASESEVRTSWLQWNGDAAITR